MNRGTAAPAAAPTPRGGSRVIVVGSGIAGMQTALELRRLDPSGAVVLVSKGTLTESNTRYAQGGIAAVVPSVRVAPAPQGARDGGEGGSPHADSVEAHIADTLIAGAGLADPHAVSVLCHGGADAVRSLQRAGVVFDTVAADSAGAGAGPGGAAEPDRDLGETGRSATTTPDLARGREAAHSAARILHLGGDSTGARIVGALSAAVGRDPGIVVLEGAAVTRVLLTGSGEALRRAAGVTTVVAGRSRDLPADAVVLATGGAGQLFVHTTNPSIATGDGLALAWRAGAAVTDLEFFQFHPTSLDVPGNPLISEAVRGEGARLIDADGRAFMHDYHPDGDLAPRDVVSRSIARHLARRSGRGRPGRMTAPVGTGPAEHVYLDATALGQAFLSRRFPGLTALTLRHGFDWSSEPVPVVPAAHYWMGGVRTDTEGRTSVPGLFAVGEVARTGVHGANRLASNSLLEAVVFATRCAEAIVDGGGAAPRVDAEPFDADADVDAGRSATQPVTRRELQEVMSDHAGVLRTGAGLELARKHLAGYHAPEDPETENLLLCARLLVHAASRRPASCGAHYRVDGADQDPDQHSRDVEHYAEDEPPVPSRSYVRAIEGAIR
ncbi:L-aspartate oxidase [Arthrobacter sp. CP30]